MVLPKTVSCREMGQSPTEHNKVGHLEMLCVKWHENTVLAKHCLSITFAVDFWANPAMPF